jgi:hypothetical protein
MIGRGYGESVDDLTAALQEIEAAEMSAARGKPHEALERMREAVWRLLIVVKDNSQVINQMPTGAINHHEPSVVMRVCKDQGIKKKYAEKILGYMVHPVRVAFKRERIGNRSAAKLCERTIDFEIGKLYDRDWITISDYGRIDSAIRSVQ